MFLEEVPHFNDDDISVDRRTISWIVFMKGFKAIQNAVIARSNAQFVIMK